ncbi:MAG TPA: hypothetical protein VKL40_02120 [Candidatus Angelobacter sp.]|nr:hypothetical protein [Candidatus Angelobacter sp.]
MEKTAAPVPAQDAVQLAHPLRCWIREIVVELGEGDGDGVGDEAVLDKLPFPHPQNRVENNKMILSTTATVSCFS